MPAPIGSSVRIVQWGIPGITGVNLTQLILQKTTQAEANVGTFWDFVTLNIIGSDGNFITGYQDNQSDDSFVYRFAVIDDKGRRSLPSEPGTAGLLSLRSLLLDRLRLRLGDDDPSRHQLDSNTMFTWDRLKISTFLDEAFSDFNSAPVTQTIFQLGNVSEEVADIILTFAEAKCLRERARIENKNQLDYSDSGLSLRIQRADAYRGDARETYERALEEAKAWKRQNRARSRGLAAQRLPFKVLRPLAMGANSTNLFST